MCNKESYGHKELNFELGEVCHKFFKGKKASAFEIIIELERLKTFYILEAVNEEKDNPR